MPTLLLELFSEEIPSRMQRGAAEQLQRLIGAGLGKNMLQASAFKTYVSPRHLAIQVIGLPHLQPDMKEEKRGPKIGAPEQAMKGFLASTGLTLEQCEPRDGYYYASIERKGRAVAEVVKEIGEAALKDFSWPKSMHWGNRAERPVAWVRPLHRIACLLDDRIVPVQFAHLTAGNLTEGHRFLAPQVITILHAEHYEPLMEDAKVIVDYQKRKEKIRVRIGEIAAQQKLVLVEDEALLDEVTGLVEWPVPLLGSFEEKFLQLPPEVLISEMKTHQRYFALRDSAGKLADRFITVANMVNADGGEKVMEGNARVVRARLSDGEFYWTQDRLTKLEDWGKKLSDVVFHAKVGMMDAKVQRIEKLAVEIAQKVGFTDEKSVRRAAQLCKADLTSGMVGEFPELQGIMGRYYARAQGENALIADAIRDHYVPRGASETDAVELSSQSELSGIIGIADRLDSISELFNAGEKPTGSKDPLALRRAALSVLRTLNKHQKNLDIALLIKTSNQKEIIEFFKDRLKQILKEQGFRIDVIEAVIPQGTDTFISELIFANARLLNGWLASDTGKISLAAIKRTQNILAAEEKKDKRTFIANAKISSAVPSEKALIHVLSEMPTKPKHLEALTAPINQFFDEVLVNEEGHREARLGLLAAVRDAANQIADFSKIEG